MQTIDAVYTGGKFEPLTPVPLDENQRVRLMIETNAKPESNRKPRKPEEQAVYAARMMAWLEVAKAHQQRMFEAHGFLPDSTPDIAADRLRDA